MKFDFLAVRHANAGVANANNLQANHTLFGKQFPAKKCPEQDSRALILASLHELSQALKKEFGGHHV